MGCTRIGCRCRIERLKASFQQCSHQGHRQAYQTPLINTAWQRPPHLHTYTTVPESQPPLSPDNTAARGSVHRSRLVATCWFLLSEHILFWRRSILLSCLVLLLRLFPVLFCHLARSSCHRHLSLNLLARFSFLLSCLSTLQFNPVFSCQFISNLLVEPRLDSFGSFSFAFSAGDHLSFGLLFHASQPSVRWHPLSSGRGPPFLQF